MELGVAADEASQRDRQLAKLIEHRLFSARSSAGQQFVAECRSQIQRCRQRAHGLELRAAPLTALERTDRMHG